MIQKKYLYLLLFVFAAFICMTVNIFISQQFNFQQVQKDYKGKTYKTEIKILDNKHASCFIVTNLRRGYVLAPAMISGPLNEFILTISCKSFFGYGYGAIASGGGYSNTGSPNPTSVTMPLNSYADNAEVPEGPPTIGINFSVPKQ